MVSVHCIVQLPLARPIARVFRGTLAHETCSCPYRKQPKARHIKDACGLSFLRLLRRSACLGSGRGRDTTFHRAELRAAEEAK